MENNNQELLLKMELIRLMTARKLDCMTDAEEQRLNNLLAEYADFQMFYEKTLADNLRQHTPEISADKSWKTFEKRYPVSRKRSLLRRVAYVGAACSALLFGVSILLSRPANEVVVQPETATPVKSLTARLVLDNGKLVVLDSLPEALLLSDRAEIQSKKGEIKYAAVNGNGSATVEYHTIEVPKYGEYRICFSDGTVVRMNAESRLRYPVTFAGNRREVWLSGEAYFEVQRDTSRHFIVHTGLADIEVLGTTFNIEAYPRQQNVLATLVTGSIRIANETTTRTITPGQQAIAGQKDIQLQEANIRAVTAWTRDMFCFDEIRLEEIMNKLGDWYGVSVFYQRQDIKDRKFSIELKKYDNIDVVLSMIEETGVLKFKKEGHTLVVQ